jgi:hypothetical protein
MSGSTVNFKAFAIVLEGFVRKAPGMVLKDKIIKVIFLPMLFGF